MKIAIIGAGFCGLAAAWHVLQYADAMPQLQVTLFDARGIGLGASGIAAGLLHPFSGAHAKLNWRGQEGVEATSVLLKVAADALGRSVTAHRPGILRLALSEMQESDFQLCANRYSEQTQWLDAETCQKLVPGSAKVPGLWIEQGLIIYSARYLRGLWQACALRGAQMNVKLIHSLQEVADFDAVIIATGAETLNISELSSLPLTGIKGQVLELAWPENCQPLTCALNSHVYLVMTEGGKSCLVGATYEKGNKEPQSDIEAAKQDILPKAYELFPPLKEAPILNCFAGMRGVAPQHRPLVKQLSEKHWVLTGMGSKGLLYHALFAKELAGTIINVLRNRQRKIK